MQNATDRFVHWMTQEALPLWSQAAMIPQLPAGISATYETLHADGSPNLAANMRVRVQARQMFVFCRAEKMGWMQGAEPLVRGMDAFIGRYAVTDCRSDGYVHLLSPSFEIRDAKRDLYDHAFFTLAYAAIYSTFDDKAALRKAKKIVEWLDEEWAHPAGGWKEGDYAAPWRRQNPHMHLLETFLFLYEASGKDYWAGKAQQVFRLFEQHFFCPKQGVLLEYFADDWALAPGEPGAIVEPGHMLEWVWLLRWYQKLLAVDTSDYCNRLFSRALEIGLDADGVIYDEVTADGQIIKATKRLWPMTELIKAAVAQARVGVPGAEAVLEKGIEDLFRFYLNVPTPGLYLDKLDAQNTVADSAAPASTLYHLIVAAIEASQWAKERA
jgi:mannose/cellobiose epimerase-like protein (N-acyl-D-glucosamine 2-epimerase family)